MSGPQPSPPDVRLADVLEDVQPPARKWQHVAQADYYSADVRSRTERDLLPVGLYRDLATIYLHRDLNGPRPLLTTPVAAGGLRNGNRAYDTFSGYALDCPACIPAIREGSCYHWPLDEQHIRQAEALTLQ